MKNTKRLTTLLITFILILVSFSNTCYAAFYAKSSYGKILFANQKSSYIQSVSQLGANWCWAAAITNVNNVLGKKNVTLQKVVELGKGKKNVSTKTPGSIQDMKRALNNLNIKYSYAESSLTPSLLRNQLKKGSPVLAFIKNPKGIGHIVTIIGIVEETNDLIFLDSNDSRNQKKASFKEFSKNWSKTFYDLK